MKITFFSDTHSLHEQVIVPQADMVVHTGDISKLGQSKDVKKFIRWFTALPHRYKVFIAGNHDFIAEREPERFRSFLNEDIIYLENESVTIEGINIWGSPITPEFFDWAFNRKRGAEIDAYWQKIPEDIDLLLTHGPPLGFGDRTVRGDRAGCADLLRHVEQKRPRYHVYGHIHEGYGRYRNAHTDFINASILDEHYRVVHQPVTIDWSMPRLY